MAHLWIQSPTPDWAVVPLEASPFPLTRLPGGDASAEALLLRVGDGNRADWLLLSSPESGVTVNGLPVSAGLRQLIDQDEVRVPGLGPLFYSTERLAQAEPLPALDHEVSCPRCRQPILPGSAAVRCPGCEVWHHSTSELPCWSYSPSCAYCDHSTALDSTFRWTPEGL